MAAEAARTDCRVISAGLGAVSAWIPAAFGLSLFLYVIRRPDLMGIPLGGQTGITVIVFPFPVLSAGLYGVAAAAVLIAVILALKLPRTGSLSGAAWPLAMLPAAFLPLPLRTLIGPALPGHMLFLIPVACLSLFLLLLFERLAGKGDRRRMAGRTALALFLAFTAFYTAVGSRLTGTAGAHSGDEGHYLIQAESLNRDHDLDIRNNFPRPLGEELRMYVHVSPNSRGGAWYSWHPFGIALLMAPAAPLGMVGRHLVLALLSGAGLAATFLLALAVGSSIASAALATILLGTSLLWGVYSSRALPEVAGASLLAWLTLAAFLQQERPRLSLVLAGAAAASLPWMHSRFLAAAPIGIAGYILFALSPDRRDRRAWIRSGLLLLLGTAGYGLYFAVQFSLFEGGNPYGFFVGHLFNFPQGMLYVLTSGRGILTTLASFLWLLPAAAVVLVQGTGRARFLSALAFVQISAVMLSACTNTGFDGGASLPGRYLVLVAPLFAAIGASVLDDSGRAARWWFAALASLSILPFVLLVNDMADYGFLFGVPHASEIVNPVFHRLARPFPAPGGYVPHLAILAVYAATLWLLTRGLRQSTRAGLLVAALAASLAVSAATGPTEKGNPGHEHSMLLLDGLDLDRAAVTWAPGGREELVKYLRETLDRPREVSAFDEAWIRAVLLQRAGEYRAAAAVFGQAAATAPNRSAPLIRMAACRRALGEREAAEELERRLATEYPAGRPVGAVFNGDIRLRGWRWAVRQTGDAREACLDLSWESMRLVGKDFGVFVHFMKDGATAFRGDHQPPVEISEWKKGELIDDRYCVPVPAGIDLRGVTAAVGLWDEKSRRLPIDGGTDRLELALEER